MGLIGVTVMVFFYARLSLRAQKCNKVSIWPRPCATECQTIAQKMGQGVCNKLKTYYTVTIARWGGDVLAVRARFTQNRLAESGEADVKA
ncbi:transporter [Edwardsiella piscicida]|nr:transporter [Edwardsiella piscicida]